MIQHIEIKKGIIACALFFLPIANFAIVGCTTFTKTSVNANNFDSSLNRLPKSIAGDYKLVWHDEFNGDSLDLNKWNYRAEGSRRQYGTVSRSTISLDGRGHLAIRVTRDGDGNYLIGEVGTEGLFSTTYGFFQCRAKMNTQIGPHVAFWLQSPTMRDSTNDPGKNGTEIDIFEYHKMTPDSIHHTIHWNGYGKSHKQIGVTVPISGIDTGFHTFGLEWTKGAYTFYIDGKQTWSTTKAVSHAKEYIILSTELSGWGGYPAKGHFPDSVVYDYVRVYKRK